MKKILFTYALCALTLCANAATRHYLCGITELTVDTLQSSTKNQYTVTFKQKCKNTAEYSKPETFYTSTVKLVLNSDDRTLDGVYTTVGASPTSSSSNVNDQTINLVTSEFTSGSTSRALHKDTETYPSTFVINKDAEGRFSIGECTLYFSERVNQTNLWIYHYSYNADDILEEGIGQDPFIFGWEAGYFESRSDIDITVTGLDIRQENSAYDAIRYFLTLQCTGVNRETSDTRNYEIALAIYPTTESIVGTFATQGSSTVLMAIDSYVKDLKIKKTRYLANDSTSSVRIKSTGTDQYSFYGGTLICTDIDANYSAVYGLKRVQEALYYHFNDTENGLEFTWNGEDGPAIIISTPEGIEDILSPETKSKKIIKDGQLIILHNNTQYNAQGVIMK